MLHLPTVTITITASTPDYVPGSFRALKRCLDLASFGRIVIFTSDPDRAEVIEGATYVKIEPFPSYEYGSIYGFHSHEYVDHFTDHILAVAWDGFILNPDAWTDEFLYYDYIGAPWPDNIVGNSGFGLFSKRFLSSLPKLDIPLDLRHCHPFDAMICRHEHEGRPGYRGRLESMGLRWPEPSFARKFSVEREPYGGSFGFHGKDTLADLVFKGII